MPHSETGYPAPGHGGGDPGHPRMPPRNDDGGSDGGRDGSDALDHPADAAHWFARMQSGEVTAADRQAFTAWRDASPDNDHDYRRLSAQWDAVLSLPHARLRGLMDASLTAPRPPVMSRRRFGLRVAAACAVPLVAGLVAAPFVFDGNDTLVNYATRKNERREVTLPDGSVLSLNGDTRVAARFGAGERRVELEQGEAFFDVRHDTSRPFVVVGGLGQVTVTGTRFNVRRDSDRLQVSVESGSVRLQTGSWWRRHERRLTAGQQAVAYPGSTLSEVAAVNVQDLTAWQRGKIIFNNVPLATVISEMNRYLPRPASLDAPALGQHRVSGIFSVDDPLAMIDALPAIAPVTLDRQQDGAIRIVAR